MTSNSLQSLRSLAKEHANLYKNYRSKTSAIHDDKNLDDIDKAYLLKGHVLQAQQDLQALQQRRYAALADINKNAEKRPVKGTAEGRAKVIHALEHGFDFHSLAAQLVSEGDREGLQSLRDYLPYAERAKQLPGPIGNARQALDTHESKLWTDSERRAAQEAREVSISGNLMESNEKAIGDYLNKQMGGGNLQPVERLYHWQGTPEAPSEQQGSFNPNESIATRRPYHG